MLVVMPRVDREDMVEVAATDDQQPVKALMPHAADPALGMRSRQWRTHGRLDHADPIRAEDLVEVSSELAVAVADEKPGPETVVVELHQQVARLLGHPAPIRIGRDPGKTDTPGSQLDEEQHVEALQEEGVDGEEVAFEDARRLGLRNSAQLVSRRFGAGP